MAAWAGTDSTLAAWARKDSTLVAWAGKDCTLAAWDALWNVVVLFFPNSGSYRVLVGFQKDFQVQLVPGRPSTIKQCRLCYIILKQCRFVYIICLPCKLQEPDFRYTTIPRVPRRFLGGSSAENNADSAT